MNTTELIATSTRLQELVRAEMALTAAAYGYPAAGTIAPLETPSVAFVVARAEAEQRAGVRLVKFYASDLREAQVTP